MMMRRVILPALLAMGTLPASALADVRMGVLGLFHSREIVARSADGNGLAVRTDRGTCALRGREAIHVSEAGGSMQLVCGGRTTHIQTLRITSPVGGVAGIELSIPGKISRMFHGRVEVTSSGGALVPIVSMDLETAVASVVAAEQVERTPIEALKAQAIAARSYLVAARGRHRGFDFCDTTHCQFLREPPAADHPAMRATRDTIGLVLAFRGAPIAALYSASCGGRTRSLAAAGLPATDGYPYFSVDCSYCVRHAHAWERRLPLDAAARQLDATRSEAARLAVDRRSGWSAVPGNNFEAAGDLDALVLRGRGAGHGVGLCQTGAAGLAVESAATFAQILDHYYPGTTLMVMPSQAR